MPLHPWSTPSSDSSGAQVRPSIPPQALSTSPTRVQIPNLDPASQPQSHGSTQDADVESPAASPRALSLRAPVSHCGLGRPSEHLESGTRGTWQLQHRPLGLVYCHHGNPVCARAEHPPGGVSAQRHRPRLPPVERTRRFRKKPSCSLRAQSQLGPTLCALGTAARQPRFPTHRQCQRDRD